jgi:hypothetical protein
MANAIAQLHSHPLDFSRRRDRPQQLLVDKLAERQGGLSDRAFAKMLHVAHTVYSAARTGRRVVSMALLEAVAGTYPDLDPYICDYLRKRRHS